jgi:DNA polymerase IV
MTPSPPPIRKIIHVDMDAFYASVEQRERPELKGRPLVVGGSPDGRGVVAAASYEARRYGVRSAMSSHKALRLCPHLVFVRPNFSLYKQVSRQIRAIFFEVTDWVEPLSLDEAYLDVTVNKLGETLAKTVAIYVKQRIRNELNLTASAGVGPNKFIAKIASDLKKPDGLVVIAPERVETFLLPLEVERFWGVGPATAKRLRALGLNTAADLRRFSPDSLERELGRFGRFLFGLAHGIDPRPVNPNRELKSRGSETTFDRDILEVEKLLKVLEELCEEVSQGLRKISRPAHTVTLKLRYADFRTITRSHTWREASFEANSILAEAARLLKNHTDAGQIPVRLIGISLSNFKSSEEPAQLSLDLRR